MDNQQRTTNDGLYIVNVMLQFVNTFENKPVDIKLEEFSDASPAMIIQQLSSAVIEKQYIQKGRYIGNWAFAMYIRIENPDTNDRISASGVLRLSLLVRARQSARLVEYQQGSYQHRDDSIPSQVCRI